MHRTPQAARHNMVQAQVRPNHVTDPRVVAAMEEIARERFLPRARQAFAYADADVPLGAGRVLCNPMTAARLVQSAAVKPADVVLAVGCGGGYLTAILSRLASTVVALESDAALTAQAERTLRELGVVNAAVVHGEDVLQGHAAQKPYDAIIVEGAVPGAPLDLLNQLAPGGRLVAVISDGPRRGGRLTVFTRTETGVEVQPLFEATLPPLVFASMPVFSF